MAEDEKAVEKDLGKKFYHDARNGGVDHALKEVHDFNRRADDRAERDRQNAMEGMASNRIMAGFKSGFGWSPCKTAGKRTVTRTGTDEKGRRGLWHAVYYDGVLQEETFEPKDY